MSNFCTFMRGPMLTHNPLHANYILNWGSNLQQGDSLRHLAHPLLPQAVIGWRRPRGPPL